MEGMKKKARVAGFLYLASAVGLLRMMYIPTALFVHGNAAATASNIAQHEWLFRIGIVTYLAGSALWLFVPLALYRLLKDVDQELAVVMVILGGLMQVPLSFVAAVTDAAALLLIRGADFLAVIDKQQREAFAMFCLNLHHQLDVANAMFWGLWLVPLGVLVYRSRFLPRLIGVWLIAAAAAWVAFCAAGFLFPARESSVFTYGQPFAMAEIALMLWLMIRGVRVERMAAAA